jgi:hypothetical protein
MWHNLKMKKVRFFLYSFLGVSLMVLAYFYVVPSGKITYSYDFSKKSFNLLGGQGFFHKFGPSDRLLDKNKIIGDPVYFNLRTSRHFNEAEIKLKYKISQDLSRADFLNIEAGVLVDKNNWDYRLYPVYNNKLNSLSEKWSVKEEEAVLFFQKNNIFASYSDFINNNDFSKTIFYNYDIDREFVLDDYEPQTRNILEINKIRGSYSFFTYVKEEALNINFIFRKIEATSENFRVRVYQANDLIFEKNISDNNFSNNTLAFVLDLPDLKEGVYKVEINSSDNIITDEIRANLTKLVFLNKLFLDELTSETTIFSLKNNFRLKALSSEHLGKIEINNESFWVDEIYKQFNVSSISDRVDKLNRLKLYSSGLLIENNGLFSFTEESFFDPWLIRLDQDLNIENFDFIVAKYNKAEFKDESWESILKVDLNGAFVDKDGYHFIFSIPFLSEIREENFVEIEKIEISLTGTSLKAKLKKYFNF